MRIFQSSILRVRLAIVMLVYLATCFCQMTPAMAVSPHTPKQIEAAGKWWAKYKDYYKRSGAPAPRWDWGSMPPTDELDPTGNFPAWQWRPPNPKSSATGAVYGANRRVALTQAHWVSGRFYEPTTNLMKRTVGNSITSYFGLHTARITIDAGLKSTFENQDSSHHTYPDRWQLYCAVSFPETVVNPKNKAEVIKGSWYLYKNTGANNSIEWSDPSKRRAFDITFDMDADGRVFVKDAEGRKTSPSKVPWLPDKNGRIDLDQILYVKRVVGLTQGPTFFSEINGSPGHTSWLNIDGSFIGSCRFIGLDEGKFKFSGKKLVKSIVTRPMVKSANGKPWTLGWPIDPNRYDAAETKFLPDGKNHNGAFIMDFDPPFTSNEGSPAFYRPNLRRPSGYSGYMEENLHVDLRGATQAMIEGLVVKPGIYKSPGSK